jgi:two-component system, NarL family, response regulator NreC
MCKVLIADDSAVMRTAIRKTLEEDRNIDVVGEASSFAETMQKIADLKPDVLLLDLHLPEKRDFTPALVKSQLCTVRTLAVSFSNDTDSKALAEGYGAVSLLDKMMLYKEMIPAIRHCHPEITKFLRKPFKRGAHA